MDKLTTTKQFEEAAKERLTKNARDYYYSGANGMVSLADAEHQFAHYRLKTKAEVDCD